VPAPLATALPVPLLIADVSLIFFGRGAVILDDFHHFLLVLSGFAHMLDSFQNLVIG
jgi:hypothetical protein